MKFYTLIFFLLYFTLVSTGFSQKKAGSAPAKKANNRPSKSTKRVEPFENASAIQMANKCVLLKTGEGNIELQFFPQFAPESVRNFLNLASIGAFDNTTFNRVVPEFVIQGGDLWTNEKLSNEFKSRALRQLPDEPNLIKHEEGILSMARGDEPNSARTSFFILLNAAPHLDGKFAAFGKVRSGMDIVKKINLKPVENEKPKEPVRITNASVSECVPVKSTESN